jgi:hypothetical protein
MSRLLRYLATMPRELRWGLFFPVGIALSFLVLALVDAGFAMSQPGPYRRIPGVLEASVGAFVAAVTRVLFPAVISPRPWLVGIIMFALDFLLRAGPTAYMLISYEYMRYRGPRMAVPVVAGAIGGLLGLFLVWRVMKSAAAQPQPAAGN